MRGYLLCVLIAVSFAALSVSSVSAHSTTTSVAKRQYYHADGYIKAIGKNARRTIYHPDPRVKHKWRTDLAYLIRVRHRAYLTLHPAPRVSWPPHHALWNCIGSSEGSPTSVNPNGHYGKLQMHADWGYGTSHHASDDPEYVQEWAAERAYRASGYSQSFLDGQWLRWDGRYDCLKYA